MAISVSIDVRDLNRLANDLNGLRQAVRERIPKRAWSSAIRKGQTKARAEIVADGGYAKAGLAGWAKSGVTGRVTGSMQARIDANRGWKSLAYWSDSGRSTTKQYKAGVYTSGHYGTRHFKQGFIRAGANGNTILAERAGKSRLPLEVFSGISPAHVLHHHRVFDSVAPFVQDVYVSEWHRQFALAIGGK